MDELAAEFSGRAKVVKVNVADSFDTSMKWGVRMLPTILVFKNGKPIKQMVGFRPKTELKATLEAAIA